MTVAMLMPGLVRFRMSYPGTGISVEEARQQTNFDFERPGSISAEESATRIRNVIASLDGSETSLLLNNDGSRLDW